MGHLVRLFSRLGKIEARYLARIAQGKLRFGVGDVTLLDALSHSLGKPKLRADLEQAYAFSSDLGLVAYVSMTEGGKGLEKIHPTPGRPVLPALAQRLPSPAAAVTRLGRVLVEPKYDGLRLQLHKDGRRIWLFTRRLENITGALPSPSARNEKKPEFRRPGNRKCRRLTTSGGQVQSWKARREPGSSPLPYSRVSLRCGHAIEIPWIYRLRQRLTRN